MIIEVIGLIYIPAKKGFTVVEGGVNGKREKVG